VAGPSSSQPEMVPSTGRCHEIGASYVAFGKTAA
jgi:hypothetical protein